jgi:four helix bundle protein
MQNFREIKVWEKSHNLTLEIYKTTEVFPKSEQYGLTNQIRRASASIPANIAEGSVQESDKQYARYLRVALGSAAELDYHLLLAYDLEYLKSDQYEPLHGELDQIKKMLTVFIHKLKA